MSEIELGPDQYRVEEEARPQAEPVRGDCLLDRLDMILVFMIGFGALFLLELLMGGAEKPGVLIALGGNYAPFVERGEIWRLLTANFLHGNMMHIIVNGYSFWILGRFVERVYGRSRLTLVFVLTATVSALASWLANASLSVGASGGITGFLGLLAAFTLHYRKRLDPRFRRSFLSNLAMIIGINVVIGVSYSGIDHWAHLGGFVAGLFLGFLVRPIVLFGGGTHPRRIRLAVRLTGVLLVAAFAAQLYALVFSVIIPEKGPARMLSDAGGRFSLAYPAFFSVEQGQDEERGTIRIGNNLDRTIVLEVVQREYAQRVIEGLRASGLDLQEGFVNGYRVIRVHGTVPVQGRRVLLRMALVEAPAGSNAAGEWVLFKTIGQNQSADQAGARLLESVVRSLVLVGGGVI